ncbi:MAG: nitroreductase family deazaflavin-dependent oxidoreductase [Candidatus Lokiarchaeota archaeon]|nr:nitroreductase family deazaflavin-dependent oxidoreductase [Candidatus Lokiarchaeota archaeon]
MTSLNSENTNKDLLPRPGSPLYNLNHDDEIKRKKTLKKMKMLNKYIVIPLYRLKILPFLGFGRIFLILTTQGRITGKKRRTPLEYQRREGIITVFSSLGDDSGWMKNLRANPDTLIVRHGFHRFQPQVEIVRDTDEKLRILKWYIIKHGRSSKMLFGWNPKTDDPESTDFTNLLKLISIVKLQRPMD